MKFGRQRHGWRRELIFKALRMERRPWSWHGGLPERAVWSSLLVRFTLWERRCECSVSASKNVWRGECVARAPPPARKFAYCNLEQDHYNCGAGKGASRVAL